MYGAQSLWRHVVFMLALAIPTAAIAIGVFDFVASPHSTGILNAVSNALFLAYLYGAVPLVAMTLPHRRFLESFRAAGPWTRRLLSAAVAALVGFAFLAVWLMLLGTIAAFLFLIPWLLLTTTIYAVLVEPRSEEHTSE